MFSYLKFTSNIIFIAGCFLLQSCMTEMKPVLDTKAAAVSIGYSGCVSATGMSTNSIKVNFFFL